MIDKNSKILAIDWGEKRLGLAIGQLEPKMALPLKTVASLSEILTVIKQEEIEVLVLGQPVSLSGEENFSHQFLEFKQQLNTRTQLPLYLVDERLSSQAADKLHISKSKSGVRDQLAAMIILETFLDSHD